MPRREAGSVALSGLVKWLALICRGEPWSAEHRAGDNGDNGFGRPFSGAGDEVVTFVPGGVWRKRVFRRRP